MTYRPTPTQTAGGRDYASTADDSLFQLVLQMLEELRIMNLQLSSMTDIPIDEVA